MALHVTKYVGPLYVPSVGKHNRVLIVTPPVQTELSLELLSIDFLGQPLRLEGSMAGWQQLFWNNTLVSQISAAADHNNQHIHEFELSNGEEIIKCRVDVSLSWQPFLVEYRLCANEQLIADGSRNTKDIEQQTPPTVTPPTPERKFSLIGLASLGLKLLKSAKVIKGGVLAVASLAAYSWLFSVQFALALVACLVFHEYGHIRAMKYFGMKTKGGIYLIPFLGGLALVTRK